MIVLKDRVKQIASVPVIPTGTLSLGAVPNGYQAFGSVLASGDQTYYVIETSNSFEIGIGRYGIEGSGTLTRDTVLTSSTGSKLSLTSRATVFITVPAAKFPFTDPSGELNLALNTLSDVGLTTPASGQSLVYNGSSWANSTITGYTTEEAQDAVGGILADTSSISFSYNDGTPSISASVRSSGITDVMISGGIDATKIGSGTVSSTEFGYLDGVTSSIQTQFGNKANTSTQVIAGTGLSGGGDLSTNRTINLANTTVTPGSYTLSSFTVDAQGRITAAASGSVDLSSYLTSSVASATYLPLAGGTLTGDLLFTDATYDIGKSGATRPRDGFFSRNLTVGGGAYAATYLSTGGYLDLSSQSYTNSNIAIRMHYGSGAAGGIYGSNGVVGFAAASSAFFDSQNGRTAICNTAAFAWANSSAQTITPTTFLYSNSANTISQRNSTNAQTFQVFETYTSSTSFGAFQIKANTGAAYQIGSAIGSAGGTNRAIDFGHWNTGGSFTSSLSINTTANQVQIGTIKAGYNISYSTGVYGINLNNGTPNCTIWSGDSSAFGSSFSGYNVFMVGHDVGVLSGYGIGSYPKFVYSNSSSLSIPQICIGNASGFSGLDLSFGTTGTPSDGEYTVTSGYGANKFGASMWLMGGRSTGNGAGGSVYIGSSTTGSSGSTRNSNFTIAQFSPFFISFNQSIASSGSPTAFTIAGAAHTTLTLSTEATDVNFNLARTVQFATGALTTQRAMRIQAPTYSFVGASTITTASTLSISGPPAAGTNATITNPWAINVESGNVRIGGSIIFPASGTGVRHIGEASSPNGVGWKFDYDQIYMTYAGSTAIKFDLVGGHLIRDSIRFYTVYGGYTPVTVRHGSSPFVDMQKWEDSAGTLQSAITATGGFLTNDIVIRNATTATGLQVHGTWTSTTSYERVNVRGKASANFEIGPENGSAGGTLRGLTLGCYPAGTTTIVGWAQFQPNVTTGVLEAFYLGPIADSTAVGGNARGANAVDLQTVRTLAANVASGQYSGLGGYNSKVTARCTFAWGYEVEATGSDSMAFGLRCYSSGASAFSHNINCGATGSYSHASGLNALADRTTMRAHSGGVFAADGDAQYVRFNLRCKTTNETPTSLYIWTSNRLIIPSGKIMFADILVSGIKSDGSAACCYKRKVAIKNVAGTTALVGTVEAIGTDIEDNVLTDVTITADNTNDALDISVTGISGETWRWVAVIEGLEIAYGV